ncbi:unnamed protein product [Closterium sp. Yama58-4]|nr:unnamed protein product [Closterium sp. Yama58-4]
MPLLQPASSVPLAGRPTRAYVEVTGRTATWHGPAQDIAAANQSPESSTAWADDSADGEPIRLFVTYAVSAWVRGEEGGAEETEEKDAQGGEGRVGSHAVNIALGVDGEWANAGSVEASGKEWVRCWGSFRLEKPYGRAVLYVQGPPPGVSILLADVRVVPVDWRERVPWLREQADRLRKGSLRLRLLSATGQPIPSAHVSANQTRRAFPLGTCVNARDLLGNKTYQSFFQSRAQGGGIGNKKDLQIFLYSPLLLFTALPLPPQLPLNTGAIDNRIKSLPSRYPSCFAHMDVNSEMLHRGFFSSWCRLSVHSSLPHLPYPTPPPYTEAIDSRITSFFTRYPSCFTHMDVNNEMLHGGFFSSRCGPSIVPRMFKFAAQIDPSLVLFLNEYHIEDGEDEKSRPEKYTQFARQLIASGAPVGGLGTQCHISAPVGAHMRHAWNILADVGLPVWVTELDVSSADEKVRADDLEICLREAFAHGGLEGVVLWGFWEGSGPDQPSMSRKNAHLVRSDWSLTEAGERLNRLLEEWTTRDVVGRTDEEGWFVVEGFAGEYDVVVRDGGQEWRTIVEVIPQKECVFEWRLESGKI